LEIMFLAKKSFLPVPSDCFGRRSSSRAMTTCLRGSGKREQARSACSLFPQATPALSLHNPPFSLQDKNKQKSTKVAENRYINSQVYHIPKKEPFYLLNMYEIQVLKKGTLHDDQDTYLYDL
jgi:hypothetical protein